MLFAIVKSNVSGVSFSVCIPMPCTNESTSFYRCNKSPIIIFQRVQHKFLMWLARCSDKRSDNLDYMALLTHFSVRSIKPRFVQYDLMFLFHIHHARLDSTVLLGAFGLNVPSRVTRNSVLWHVPRARVNVVQRSLFTRTPSTCNSFLKSDSTVDFFAYTSCSFKSRVIKFSNTQGTFK